MHTQTQETTWKLPPHELTCQLLEFASVADTVPVTSCDPVSPATLPWAVERNGSYERQNFLGGQSQRLVYAILPVAHMKHSGLTRWGVTSSLIINLEIYFSSGLINLLVSQQCKANETEGNYVDVTNKSLHSMGKFIFSSVHSEQEKTVWHYFYMWPLYYTPPCSLSTVFLM